MPILVQETFAMGYYSVGFLRAESGKDSMSVTEFPVVNPKFTLIRVIGPGSLMTVHHENVFCLGKGVHGSTNIRLRCWWHACADYFGPGTDVLHPP